MKTFWKRLRERLRGYRNLAPARSWLEGNGEKVRRLFEDKRLRDFVFQPFKQAFSDGDLTDDRVRSVITQVAVANAVMAGLPGKMGLGVTVAMALEVWMAYSIARNVGIAIEKPSDAIKYFGVLAGVAGTILFLFRHLLGFGFSLFSSIPGVNPLIPAEIMVTDLVGVMFWLGFKEARESGSFAIPRRVLRTAMKDAKSLFKHQMGILEGVLSPSNLRRVGQRLKAWLTGEIPSDVPALRGDLFSAVAMGYLIAGETRRLSGPLGVQFVEAVRRAYSAELSEATVEEIGAHLRTYSAEELPGVLALIKGHFFEQLVELHENADGDEWMAEINADPIQAGSDIVFTNAETGVSVAVSLKATDDAHLIEAALQKYPDIPIMTTDEVSAAFDGSSMVQGSGTSNRELGEITQENFEEAVAAVDRVDIAAGATAGVSLGVVVGLWPFVAAYLKGSISYEQLERAFKKSMGDGGVSLASRVAWGLALGPVFAWYLLARGAMATVQGAEAMARAEEPQRRLIYGPVLGDQLSIEGA